MSATSAAESKDFFRRLATLNWGALLFAFLLTLIGIVTIRSAGAELEVRFASRQALWLAVGLIAALAALGVNYRFLLRAAWPLYGLSLGLLVFVLVAGEEAGGARSWIGLGSMGGQPSELAKIATALLLARHLGETDGARLSGASLAIGALLTAVPVALIVLQRDLGSAAMFFPIFGAIALVAGFRRHALVLILVALAITAPLVWNFGLREYQRQRVVSFLSQSEDPLGAGYQLRQSRIAVGSGQVTGRGYMQGTQSRLRFLPARHTDFIIAVLAEEWGFLGVLMVVGLYAAFFWESLEIARRAADRTGLLLVVGLVSILAGHVVYNTAMVIGWLPITGIPLPFLSYGGSFLLASLLSVGIILGVDFRRHANL